MRAGLLEWEHERTDLAKWMILEKRSLPDVSVALYKVIQKLDMDHWLQDKGCSEVSHTSAGIVPRLASINSLWTSHRLGRRCICKRSST